MPRSVMLFAAGFGTRMKPLTDNLPKPMIKVAGQPLIDHALRLTETFETGRVVVNLHYKSEILQKHLAGRSVTTLLEYPDILDTGGGLKNALPVLGKDPVFTMNSDAVWAGPNPMRILEENWDPAVMDALLMCVPVCQTVAYKGTGDFELRKDGRLLRGEGSVYGGIQIVSTDLLHSISEQAFSLNRLWDVMLRSGRAYGLNYTGRWCDVGHPGGIAHAEKMLRDANV